MGCLGTWKQDLNWYLIHSSFFFKVEVMMEGIIQAFKDRVAGRGWIDNQTVEAVKEKVCYMRCLTVTEATE